MEGSKDDARMTDADGGSVAVSTEKSGEEEPVKAKEESKRRSKVKSRNLSDNLSQISHSTKKKKNNLRLRKLISPKGPIMVLNEVVGQVIYKVTERDTTDTKQLFHAQCEVRGETFTGIGSSKQMAKNMCAERALRAVTIKRSLKVTQYAEEGAGAESASTEEEMPWASLASLALFKMFNDWADGNVLPMELWKQSPAAPDKNMNVGISATDPGTESSKPDKCVSPARQTGRNNDRSHLTQDASPSESRAAKIPENPTERHPVQLLNEIHKGIGFEFMRENSSTDPQKMFFIGVTKVDGKVFKGQGLSKKEAKKNCAVNILKALHGIHFVLDLGVGNI